MERHKFGMSFLISKKEKTNKYNSSFFVFLFPTKSRHDIFCLRDILIRRNKAFFPHIFLSFLSKPNIFQSYPQHKLFTFCLSLLDILHFMGIKSNKSNRLHKTMEETKTGPNIREEGAFSMHICFGITK
jgi:hypothetical protein